MKKLLLKTMLLLCALVVGGVSSVWATDNTETIDFPTSSSNVDKSGTGVSVSGTDVSVSISLGTGSNLATNTDGTRIYNGNSMVFSSTTKKISKIVFSYKRNKKQTNGVSASNGSFTTAFTVGNSQASGLSATWEASNETTTSVTFTVGSGSGNYALQSAVVTFVEEGGGSTVATPTFSPAAGAVISGTEVTISCATDGATIHYTVDGTDPTASSPTYSSAITIDAAKTIKAIAIKADFTNSAIATATYSIAQVATPSISPTSGAVASGTEVTLSCATEGASIYYTIGADPADPTSSSSLYDPSSKPIITANTTIKAIAIKKNMTNSAVASASYTIATPCATPTFSVAAGEVAKGTTVSLSCATDGATIYYTTDGTTPTTSSSVYSSAITINSAQTIKAIAVKVGNANSAVASASYTIIDYATLPFDYDGNGTGTLPTGLTVSGTGTYSSSPKIKFDGAGDYVILKLGQAPGELKFKIKGNGSGSVPQSGTFKVQTSVDGSSYSDLDSYDTLGDAETKTYTNLDPSTRFIKWVYTTKTVGNVALGGINLTGCETVTVTDAGYATYKTTGKVTFPTGVKGYIATATDASTVTLTSKESVPAGTPIVLKADAGTYYLPTITGDTDAVPVNLLAVSDGTVKGGATIYALAKINEKVGFYQVSSDLTIDEGKVYLDTSAAGAKAFLTFDFDEADGIRKIQDSSAKIQDAKIFNLAGQRMSKMQRGINIVNGKKVVVK